MARYCFYCGHSLQTGEKCDCRSTDGSNQDPVRSADQTSRQQAQDNASQDGTKNKKRQKAYASSSSAAHARTFFTQSKADRRAELLRLLPALFAGFQSVSRYVTQPVDVIRDSVKLPSKRRFISFMVFQSIVAGLLMITAAGRPSLAFLFGASRPAVHPALLFIWGAVLSISVTLLLSLAYTILLRYLYRQTFHFQTILESLSPISLYMGLFLLFALFSLRTSLVSAGILLLIGLGLSLLIQYFAIRQLTDMEDNRLVMLVFSTSFLTLSIAGMVLGLA